MALVVFMESQLKYRAMPCEFHKFWVSWFQAFSSSAKISTTKKAQKKILGLFTLIEYRLTIKLWFNIWKPTYFETFC